MKNINEMSLSEIISRYNVVDGAAHGKPGCIGILAANLAKKDKVVDAIFARKEEILAFIAAEKAAKEAAIAERAAKIAAIDGLKEIQDALDDLAAWHEEFNASFDDVGGLGVRAFPQYDIDAMKAAHPQAAAYLKAESYAYKHNYELAAIGRKALEGVINGDWEKAMEDMEAELKAFSDRHMWD